mgnify:CR=1 FL=1
MPTRTRAPSRKAQANAKTTQRDAAKQSASKRRRSAGGSSRSASKSARTSHGDDDDDGEVVVMFWTKGTGRHAPFLRKDGKLQRRLDARTAALLGLTGQEAEQTTVVEEVEEEEQKTNSGLKTFVARVAAWVYHNGTSNSAGMVDHLAREYVNMQATSSSKAKANKESHLDDRSIRRRVYDALNVLNAIGVVSKATTARREAEWVGYLRNCGPTDIERVVDSHLRTVQRVHSKARRLRQTLSLIAAYKQLAARNTAAEVATPEEHKLQPPFLVMGAPRDCSLGVQRVTVDSSQLRTGGGAVPEEAVQFAFSAPPVTLDDSAVLTAMGMGLPPLSPADVFADDAHLRSQRATAALQAATAAAQAHLPSSLQAFAEPTAMAAADVSQHALYFLASSYKDSAVDVGAPVEEDAASVGGASSVPTTLFAVSAEPEGEIAAIQARLYNAEHTREQLAAVLAEDAATRAAMATHIQAARQEERLTTAAIRAAKSEAKASRVASSSKKRGGRDRDSSSASTGSGDSSSAGRTPAAGGILGGEASHSHGRKRGRSDSEGDFASFDWHSGYDSRGYLFSTSGERAPGLSDLLDTALAWPQMDTGYTANHSVSDLNSSFGSSGFVGGRRGAERFSAAASLARSMGGVGGGLPAASFGGLPSAANMGMARTSTIALTSAGSPVGRSAPASSSSMSIAQRLASATPRTAATAALLAGVSPRTAEAASNIAGMTRRLSAGGVPAHTPARTALHPEGLSSVLSPATADAAVALVQVGSSLPNSSITDSKPTGGSTFDV